MSTNDLTTPLGLQTARKPKRRFSVPIVPILGGLVVAVFAVFIAWIALVKDPYGGEPVATVAIEAAPVTAPGGKPVAGEPGGGAAIVDVPGAPNVSGAAAVEEASGVKVVRAGEAAAPTAVIVRAPSAPANVQLAPLDLELTEKGRQGVLPRISKEGARPLDVYARPVVVPPALAKTQNPPRIAILVGGLGIGESSTASAIARLPAPVTLAFAPYGADLEAIVAKARGGGHEVMLQSPMEPFDYPDNDPGPQTLLAESTAEQNLDRLRWQLSRFSAYVGVVNYMGARFTASEAAISPMLKEIFSRGLMFADDGSSPRSLTPQLAGDGQMPFAKADVVIDAEPSAKAIDAALAQLEKTAREKGAAFGVATALPISVDRIAAWSEKLAERGILLVPVTGLVAKH